MNKQSKKTGTVQNFHIAGKYLHELLEQHLVTAGSNLALEIHFTDKLLCIYTNIVSVTSNAETG